MHAVVYIAAAAAFSFYFNLKMGRRRRSRRKVEKVKEVSGFLDGIKLNQMKRLVSKKRKSLVEEGEKLVYLNSIGVKNGVQTRREEGEAGREEDEDVGGKNSKKEEE